MASGSTLTAWLSGLDGPRLARVLATRKDTASPPEPRSVGELADRLQRPGSVALALPRLTLPDLQVAEAVAALGTTASREALAKLLGATASDAAARWKRSWRLWPGTRWSGRTTAEGSTRRYRCGKRGTRRSGWTHHLRSCWRT